MKQIYEVKKQTKIVGTLDKKGDEYIVTVEGKEVFIKRYYWFNAWHNDYIYQWRGTIKWIILEKKMSLTKN